MLNATSVSASSGLHEASALRAQLAALNEKFKQLEKVKASQLALTGDAGTTATKNVSNPTTNPALTGETEASTSINVNDKTEGVQAATANDQPSDVCDGTDDPPATVEEGTEVPPTSENLRTDDIDDADVVELEDDEEVLTQKSVDSPPPDNDVDQGEKDIFQNSLLKKKGLIIYFSILFKMF